VRAFSSSKQNIMQFNLYVDDYIERMRKLRSVTDLTDGYSVYKAL